MAELNQTAVAAQQYIAGYLSLETQDADAGPTDSQLATIIVSLLQEVGRSTTGAILDIGAGEGPLFSRLFEDDAFRNAPNWLYLAVDEEEKLNRIHKLARTHRASRRVELVRRV